MKQIAKPDDRQALIELYNICFPGEEEYCEKFFDLVWKPENTLVYRDGVKIVSMLQMFELTLTDGTQEFSSYYIFGAGTHPDYRGRAIMRELISESERINYDKDFAVLIAASESLKTFYGRLGFKDGFSYGKAVVKAKAYGIVYEVIDFTKCEKNEVLAVIEKINKIYLDSTQGEVVVKRTADFILKELSCRDAKLFMTDDSYAIAEISEDEVFFIEYFGKNSEQLMAQILHDYKVAEAEACSLGGTHSFGMYKNLSCEKKIHGYFNLLFN